MKDENKEKEAGNGPFFKKTSRLYVRNEERTANVSSCVLATLLLSRLMAHCKLKHNQCDQMLE